GRAEARRRPGRRRPGRRFLAGTEVLRGGRPHVEPLVRRDEIRLGCERREVGKQPRVEAAAKQTIEWRAPRARRFEANCPEKAPAWQRLKARDRRRKGGEEKIAPAEGRHYKAEAGRLN